MRPCLAVVVPLLGGCSFIYNPDHINKDIDAKVVDTEHVVDVNPAGLTLTYAYPAVVYEGVGTGGSRPAVVVIRGEEIAPSATVTVVPMTGAPTQIALNEFKVADDHRWIALSITVPVDETQDETGTHATAAVPLAITVDNGMGYTASLPMDALKLQWLDQLKTPITAPPPLGKLYSIVNVGSAIAFTPDATAHRVAITSESSITINGGITANGAATNPGPGGCAGGAANGSGPATNADGVMCIGNGGAASGILAAGGGGAGYATTGMAGGGSVGGGPGAMVGDPQISSYATNVAGGGGGGSPTTVLGGSPGGGGGGTVELTAAGDIHITSTGAAIAALGGPQTGGGGGAGGTILVRSGGMLDIAKPLDVSPVNGSGNGGPASAGRARFDAAKGGAPNGYQGPMIQTIPYFSTTQLTSDSAILVAGQAGNSSDFKGLVYDKDGSPVSNFDLLFGQSVAKPSVMLKPGYNRVCVLVPGGNILTTPESGNCAEIAFLPTGN